MRQVLHWFACHTVLIVLSAFLLIAIVYRDLLFGMAPEPLDVNLLTVPDPVSEPVITKFSEQPAEQVPDAIKTGPVNSASASQIQQQEQYDFRPAEALPVDPADPVDISEEDLLQQARKAYWNEQFDSAKLLYLEYIEKNPDNPDGFGELGNLLSTLGELDQAANMYRYAADLMLQQGDTEQAQQLHQVLDSIEVIQSADP